MVKFQGRELISYVDPFPGQKDNERVFDVCGNCDGGGVYQGYSRWIWQKGQQVAPWCFACNGSGRSSLSVGSLRKRAKNAALQRDYAEVFAAEREAAIAESNAKIFAADWEAAQQEQARRAALVGGFVGEVGERVKGLVGKVVVAKSYDASFGYRKAIGMFLVVELDDGKVLKISGVGRSLFGHSRGDRIMVAGSVKAHENYQGQDQSVLQRAKIEVVERVPELV